jgi:hypothetical protein
MPLFFRFLLDDDDVAIIDGILSLIPSSSAFCCRCSCCRRR